MVDELRQRKQSTVNEGERLEWGREGEKEREREINFFLLIPQIF